MDANKNNRLEHIIRQERMPEEVKQCMAILKARGQSATANNPEVTSAIKFSDGCLYLEQITYSDNSIEIKVKHAVYLIRRDTVVPVVYHAKEIVQEKNSQARNDREAAGKSTDRIFDIIVYQKESRRTSWNNRIRILYQKIKPHIEETS